MFSSTLWTFITCLPYRILYLTYAICPPCHSEQFGEIFFKLTDTFFRILVIGIVINPVITVFTQRLYRECLLLYVTRAARVCGIPLKIGRMAKYRNSQDAAIAMRRPSRLRQIPFESEKLTSVSMT